jgi:outer membrane biosynthesis protein TonB
MPSRNTKVTSLIVVLACGLSLALTGCEKTVKASPPVAATPMPQPADSKPITNIAPDTTATPPGVAEAPPPAPPPTSEATLPVTSTHSKPAPPPRKQAAEPQTAETPAEQTRPPAPQISPEMSPNDQATYAHKTDEDISAAEKNLQQAADKQLSAAQNDLVEKIRSFLSQSHEASKAGDWARAQNLAQKARLLSVELVGSL